jgi:hypothetical protein
MFRCKTREALEVRRTFCVRRNVSRPKRNAADGRFSTASYTPLLPLVIIQIIAFGIIDNHER